MASRRVDALGVLSILLARAAALENGLALTPIMGYNSWNDLRCDDVSSEALRARADALVELGLAEIGYTYMNVDDCWSSTMTTDGALVEDPKAFPEGLKALADYVHSKGLKFGIYGDRGLKTCAFRPGSGGLEALHARQFASWGVDYLKYDSCYASSFHETAFKEYSAMRDALNATGRPIVFSLCGWNSWYAPEGASLGNSWRIAPDCDEWANVYVAIRTNEGLARFARPGSFNDPDMLVGSDPRAAVHLAPHQVQAQFSMWAIMAAPLLLGSRLLSMSEADLAVYKNTEVIAVSQDPLGKQGEVVWSNCPVFVPRDNFWMSPWSMPYDVAIMWTQALTALLALLLPTSVLLLRPLRSPVRKAKGAVKGVAKRDGVRGCQRCCLLTMLAGACALLLLGSTILAAIWYYRPTSDPCQQVWSRELADGSRAVCLINFAPIEAAVMCDEACMARAGLHGVVKARDLIRGTELDATRTLSALLQPEGGSVLLRVRAT